MADARTMSALAARIVEFMETELLDHDPLTLRGALIAAGEIFLQKAAMERIIRDLNRNQ